MKKLFSVVAVLLATTVLSGCAPQTAEPHGGSPGTMTTASEAHCDPAADHTAALDEALDALPLRDRVNWNTSGLEIENPCAELTNVVARVETPTVSSPEVVMFFSRGEFVGLANPCAYLVAGDVSVTGSTATVEYRYMREGIDVAQAGMTGRETVTYTYDPVNGTLSNSGYSTELKNSQPSCEPGTGEWRDSSQTKTSVAEAGAACIADLQLDLIVPEVYSNGSESDGGMQYILRIHNSGSTPCKIARNYITLTVSGPGKKSCHPQVQNLTLGPDDTSSPLASASGVWGTCVTSAIVGPGQYSVVAQVSHDGVSARSSTQSFRVR